ncbi:unnamed protein product [Clonostachys rosea]|uniref:PiggyBac transposable element-derived protein domain-containing protein n=1 Tax=Bionectria ochroleuca TaxID=29856 RepID=A0ABY6TUU0_BIOOC|nr:unnamed protein product [Clonostachys rosea]
MAETERLGLKTFNEENRFYNSVYRKGATLLIEQHIPPPPFGGGYDDKSLPRKEAYFEEGETLTQLQWCTQHPPLETEPPADARRHTMEILDVVAGGTQKPAQLVKCQLDGGKEVFMAKIYDPLFHRGYSVDTTFWADSAYSKEAAVYEGIKRRGDDGRLSPKYHGSWTSNLPVDDASVPARTRPVRMILMEYIEAPNFAAILKEKRQTLLTDQERL